MLGGSCGLGCSAVDGGNLGVGFWGSVRFCSSCRLGSCAMPFVYPHPHSVMPDIAMSKDTFLIVS